MISVSEAHHDHPGPALPLLPRHRYRPPWQVTRRQQRYRCRECLEGRGRTFLLDYSYAGQSPAVKEQIAEMAMNTNGIRDAARVLKISPTMVITSSKKRTCPPNGEPCPVGHP